MAKAKSKKTSRVKSSSNSSVAVASEPDAVYILKIVLYLILGSLWIRVTNESTTIPLPVGLIIGLLFARTDRLAFDRKMAYAILLLAMFIGFWLPIGLELVL